MEPRLTEEQRLYLRYDWEMTARAIRQLSEPTEKDHRDGLRIKKLIFNPPATIIFWNDGTKTVVRCQPSDVYDQEKGFVMAYFKKLLGNDNTFNKEITKFLEHGGE